MKHFLPHILVCHPHWLCFIQSPSSIGKSIAPAAQSQQVNEHYVVQIKDLLPLDGSQSISAGRLEEWIFQSLTSTLLKYPLSQSWMSPVFLENLYRVTVQHEPWTCVSSRSAILTARKGLRVTTQYNQSATHVSYNISQHWARESLDLNWDKAHTHTLLFTVAIRHHLIKFCINLKLSCSNCKYTIILPADGVQITFFGLSLTGELYSLIILIVKTMCKLKVESHTVISNCTS